MTIICTIEIYYCHTLKLLKTSTSLKRKRRKCFSLTLLLSCLRIKPKTGIDREKVYLGTPLNYMACHISILTVVFVNTTLKNVWG